MNIDLAELAQHEAAWLAYGNRRASRLRWRKATNADMAANLDVVQVFKKIEAHDKRVWVARAVARLFTSIERQRELLVYRLGNDVLAAIKALPTEQTLVFQDLSISKIAALTVRASRFSWFKKPFSAFMGWANQKMSHAIVIVEPKGQLVELPAEFDADDPLECFRKKMYEELYDVMMIWPQCLKQHNNTPTVAEKDQGFDACFSPFRKKVKELRLYYHPDKVSEAKVKAAGITLETFRVEAEIAFKKLEPMIHAFEGLRKEVRLRLDDRLTVSRLSQDCDKMNAKSKDDIARWSAECEERADKLSQYNLKLAEQERLLREKLENGQEKAKESVQRFEKTVPGSDKLLEVPTPGTVSETKPQLKVNPVDADVAPPLVSSTMPSVNLNGFFAVNRASVSGKQACQATHRRTASH